MVSYARIQKTIESSKPHTIGYVSGNPNFDFPAVYLVSDSQSTIYVGETNSLYHRMGEHKDGVGNYSLLRKMRKYGLGPDVSGCRIKYIKVEDFRERKFTEDLLKWMYRPVLNYRR